MVDLIQQQQAVRLQRASIEQERRKALSQSNLRQATSRQSLLQRQQQFRQLSEREKELSSIEEQLIAQQREQERKVSTPDRSALKQSALNFLLAKGKANEAFRALTKKEQAEVRDMANELEFSRAMVQARSVIPLIESQVGQSLSPEIRQSLVQQALKTGKATYYPQSQQYFTPASQGYFAGPVPRGYSEEAFRQTGRLSPAVPNKLFYGPVPRFTDPDVFARTGKKVQLPLVESAASGTFSTKLSKLGQDITRAVKERDLPQVVRSVVGEGSGLFISEAGIRTGQALQDFGIAREGPLATQVSFPTEKIIGGLALGSLFAPTFQTGTVGQVAVSRYVKNGIVYEIDNLGNVVSAKPIAEVNKNIAEFRQALKESAVFKKANSRYFNEPNLIMKTRELINKANPSQLKSLRELYKESGRLDLFDDILAQEKDLIKTTNQRTATLLKDTPSNLVGAGQSVGFTSTYAGTGQYERTNQVSIALPSSATASSINQQFIPLSASQQGINQSLGLQQTAFQKIKPIVIPRSRTSQTEVTKSTQNQLSSLGLALGQKSIQRQRSQQATSQVFKQGYRQGTRERYRPRFKTPILLLPRPKSQYGSKFSPIKVDNLNIGIEVKRFGKFQKVGSATTLESALRKGIKIADITLARSFRLRESGSGQLLDTSNLPRGFRRSKALARTFVEESAFALSTPSEKKEIKYFKNAKGRTRRSFI